MVSSEPTHGSHRCVVYLMVAAAPAYTIRPRFTPRQPSQPLTAASCISGCLPIAGAPPLPPGAPGSA